MWPFSLDDGCVCLPSLIFNSIPHFLSLQVYCLNDFYLTIILQFISWTGAPKPATIQHHHTPHHRNLSFLIHSLDELEVHFSHMLIHFWIVNYFVCYIHFLAREYSHYFIHHLYTPFITPAKIKSLEEIDCQLIMCCSDNLFATYLIYFHFIYRLFNARI